MTERGLVNRDLEAILSVRLRGPNQIEHVLDAMVDTGYTGSITLPLTIIHRMVLPCYSGGRVVLADGSVRRFDTFSAEIFWAGLWQKIIVSNVGDESFIGMTLISGRGLWLEAITGGVVEIRNL